MKIICFIFFTAMMLSGQTVLSQTDKSGGFDKEFVLLQKDLRAEKKQLIAANLSLTESDAKKFSLFYDQYSAELEKLYKERHALLKEYSNFEKLTAFQAATLNKRVFDNEESTTKLRQKYLPIVEKILPGRKTVLFFQIEKRLNLLIELQIASENPLVIQETGKTDKKDFRTLSVSPLPN